MKKFLSIFLASAMALSISMGAGATDIKVGDMNGNSRIDISDLSIVSLYLIGDVKLSRKETIRADFDGDSEVTLADLALMKMYVTRSGLFEEVDRDDGFPDFTEKTND